MFFLKLHLFKKIYVIEISCASSINETSPNFHLAFFDCDYQLTVLGSCKGREIVASNFVIGPPKVDFGGPLSKVWTLSFAALIVEYSLEKLPTIILITPWVSLELSFFFIFSGRFMPQTVWSSLIVYENHTHSDSEPS